MRWALFAAVVLVPLAGRADELLGNSVRRGDIYVEISKAVVAPVPLMGAGDKVEPSKKECLMLFVGIINYSQSKGREYRGWMANLPELDQRVVVRDDLGNTYRRVQFGDRKVRKQRPDGKSLTPSDGTLLDLLVFEKPADKARELRVTLAGSQLGEKEDIQINIPVQRTESSDVIYDADAAAKEFLRTGAKRVPAAPPDKEKVQRDEIPAPRKPKEVAADPRKNPDPQADGRKAMPERKKAADRAQERKDERAATSKMREADKLSATGKRDAYRKALQEIVDEFPDTTAGKKAAKLLK
jgi:hypothetical protein